MEQEKRTRSIEPLFALGRVAMTPGAAEAFGACGADPWAYLARHMTGDWGEVSEQDQRENEFSRRFQYRILSAYRLPDETRFWIITEADRSATTILLPDEY